MSTTQIKPSQTQLETMTIQNDNEKDTDIDNSDVNGDIGLKLFADHKVPAAAIDPKVEQRLVRKIDMFIIPFICMTYLVTYIDKATLGYGQFNEFQAR
jgi:hypothetical protein